VTVEFPRVLSARLLKVWKQLAWSRQTNSPHPVLITGGDGCGKSDCILAFSQLQGKHLRQVSLTPETEPSLLIGQLTPNDKPEGMFDSVRW